jgi:hypothetical protein
MIVNPINLFPKIYKVNKIIKIIVKKIKDARRKYAVLFQNGCYIMFRTFLTKLIYNQICLFTQRMIIFKQNTMIDHLLVLFYHVYFLALWWRLFHYMHHC